MRPTPVAPAPVAPSPVAPTRWATRSISGRAYGLPGLRFCYRSSGSIWLDGARLSGSALSLSVAAWLGPIMRVVGAKAPRARDIGPRLVGELLYRQGRMERPGSPAARQPKGCKRGLPFYGPGHRSSNEQTSLSPPVGVHRFGLTTRKPSENVSL